VCCEAVSRTAVSRELSRLPHLVRGVAEVDRSALFTYKGPEAGDGSIIDTSRVEVHDPRRRESRVGCGGGCRGG
jgi:hypothetical protein